MTDFLWVRIGVLFKHDEVLVGAYLLDFDSVVALLVRTTDVINHIFDASKMEVFSLSFNKLKLRRLLFN